MPYIPRNISYQSTFKIVNKSKFKIRLTHNKSKFKIENKPDILNKVIPNKKIYMRNVTALLISNIPEYDLIR